MGRARRRLGTALLVLGSLLLVYGAAVYFWRDPATDLYARWRQDQLNGQLEDVFRQFRESFSVVTESTTLPVQDTQEATAADGGPTVGESEDPTAQAKRTSAAAAQFLDQLELGQPIGRLVIPKLGIDPVFVNGTRWGPDLSRGPGRYPETSLPGLGKVTAIAGHRTTFGAPFRHIDRLEPGDEIVLELPYGTFRYRVVGHKIVDDSDWSIIDPRPYDALVLSACHPLYGASQRWVVFARLADVETPDGATYSATVAGGEIRGA